MKNTNELQNEEQGSAYWLKEVEYFEKALEGLQQAYAVIKAMHKHAEQQLNAESEVQE